MSHKLIADIEAFLFNAETDLESFYKELKELLVRHNSIAPEAAPVVAVEPITITPVEAPVEAVVESPAPAVEEAPAAPVVEEAVVVSQA